MKKYNINKMATTFKGVVKYGANQTLQYDELHRGDKLLITIDGTQLTPDWYSKSDQQILDEIKTAIESIYDFNFAVEEYSSDFNIISDNYQFGPKEFAWKTISVNGFITEDMIETVQTLFFNLNVAFKEINVFVETIPSDDAITDDDIISLPTLNEAIVEFYGDRKPLFINSSHIELLNTLNNELQRTPSDEGAIIELFAINSTNIDNNQKILSDEFSVKLIVNDLAGIAETADSELNKLNDFMERLGFHSFHTFWMLTTSELFAI